MDLPVTHFLYAACTLVMAGLWLLLSDGAHGGSSEAERLLERQLLARNALLSGVVLAAGAFARYWGVNQGMSLAFTVLTLLMFLSVLGGEQGEGSDELGREEK